MMCTFLSVYLIKKQGRAVFKAYPLWSAVFQWLQTHQQLLLCCTCSSQRFPLLFSQFIFSFYLYTPVSNISPAEIEGRPNCNWPPGDLKLLNEIYLALYIQKFQPEPLSISQFVFSPNQL